MNFVINGCILTL